MHKTWYGSESGQWYFFCTDGCKYGPDSFAAVKEKRKQHDELNAIDVGG